MRAESVLEMCRVFGANPVMKATLAAAPTSYRDAGCHLAMWLGLDPDDGKAAASELIAEGHLPRSFGRAIVRPSFDGLVVLAVAIVARAAGLSRGAAAEMATRGTRDSFLAHDLEGVALTTEPGVQVSLSVGSGSVAVRFPPGLYEEINRLVEACQHDG